MWHTFGTSSYTDELCSIALRLPGRVEGYFERLSPMLRQGGGPSPHRRRRARRTYGIEFDVDSIQPCSRSN